MSSPNHIGRCRRRRRTGKVSVWDRLSGHGCHVIHRRAKSWPGVYSAWGVYDDVRVARRLSRSREVVALMKRGGSDWVALMPRNDVARSWPTPSGPWWRDEAPSQPPLRPIHRSLSSRLGPLRHVMPLLRPQALAWLVGLGLWTAPHVLRAQPPAPTVQATEEGALLSFEPGPNGTYVCMVLDPRTAPALGDVVRIVPAGTATALVTNNWNTIGPESNNWYRVAHIGDDGAAGLASSAAGRLRYLLFDDLLPNDEPTMPESIPVVSLPDTLYACLSESGTLTLPMGPFVQCSTHPIQAIDVDVAVDPTYVSNSSTTDRVFVAEPNGPGPCGNFTVTATNDTGSDWDTAILVVGYEGKGRIKEMFNSNPGTNGLEGALVSFTKDGWTITDTTDQYGRFDMIIPWEGQTAMSAVHQTTDVYNDTLNVAGNVNKEVYMNPEAINEDLLHASSTADHWHYQFPVGYYVGNQPEKEGDIVAIVEDLLGQNWETYIDTTHTSFTPPPWPFTEQRGFNTGYGPALTHSYIANTSHYIVFGQVNFVNGSDISQGGSFNSAQEEIIQMFGFEDVTMSGYLLTEGNQFSATDAERKMAQAKLWLGMQEVPDNTNYMIDFEKFSDSTVTLKPEFEEPNTSVDYNPK